VDDLGQPSSLFVSADVLQNTVRHDQVIPQRPDHVELAGVPDHVVDPQLVSLGWFEIHRGDGRRSVWYRTPECRRATEVENSHVR
jgi:hypothetical protein